MGLIPLPLNDETVLQVNVGFPNTCYDVSPCFVVSWRTDHLRGSGAQRASN